MAERSIRDFQVPFVVAPYADAWASANGFGLSAVDPDGSRHYVRGSGLLTGQMMCVVRQSGPYVRLEAYIHARLIARIGALFLIPSDMSIEPGGFRGALPRKICRDAVDKLLAQLGQTPITAADNAAAPRPVAQPTAQRPAATQAAPTVPSAAMQYATTAAPAATAAAAYPAASYAVAAYPAATYPAAPYAPAAAYSGFRATATRPMAIAIAAIVYAVNALVCLNVARELFFWFSYLAEEDDMNYAAVHLLFALAYLAIAGGSVAVAWRMWTMRRDAWLAAIEVSAALIAITVISSAFVWEFEPLGIVGIAVHGGLLVYLNLATVRALFGRGAAVSAPTTR